MNRSYDTSEANLVKRQVGRLGRTLLFGFNCDFNYDADCDFNYDADCDFYYDFNCDFYYDFNCDFNYDADRDLNYGSLLLAVHHAHDVVERVAVFVRIEHRCKAAQPAGALSCTSVAAKHTAQQTTKSAAT